MSARAPSLWLDPPPEPGSPLEGDLEVDVAIVGAGYTGLSAALALAEAGADVCVLERDYAGFGASGRNAGHLTPTIGKDVPTLLRLYGRERAGALVRLAESAVEHVESLIADRGFDCDYEPVGNVLAGIHVGQQPTIDRAVAAAGEAGAAVRALTPAEIRERELPEAFVCGYLEERGGVLDPGKYLRALRSEAGAAGARIFEATRVDSIIDGPRMRIETPRGTVSAAHCLLATNAYTGALGRLRSVATPLSVSLFATEPLDSAAVERVGWHGREGVYTAHEVLESFRLTADNRIVGGSRFVRYAYGSRIPPDEDAATFRRLETLFRARFPELADVSVERFWSGPICFTLDFLPAIGRSGAHGNLLYSIAYAGHGVALASHAGAMVARMAIGEEPPPEWSALLDRRRPPLPPEPLRWLVARGIIAGLEALDRRHDRRAVAAHPNSR